MTNVAGPFETLNPRLLLLLGIVSLAIGSSLLLSAYIEVTIGSTNRFSITSREKYFISGVIAISAVVFAIENDWVLQVYGWVSLLLIILLPILFTLVIMRMIIDKNI